MGQRPTKMFARDVTRMYSSSDESHRSERSSRRNAVVVGGFAVESKAKVSHVQAAKMLDEMGPMNTKAMSSTRGSVLCRLLKRVCPSPRR